LFFGLAASMMESEGYVMANTITRDAPPRRAPEVGSGRPRGRTWAALAGFIGASLGAGVLGSIATASSVATWYQTLERPPLAPPGAVFGPVWTTLYVLMGTSAWLVWKHRDHPAARRTLAIFGVQLAVNTLWSFAFFGLQSPLLALAVIVPLWGLIAAYMVSAWPVRRAATWLFAPYLAWVSFATYLNAGYWWLNR
jgi:tryptophan-rich sensory protein